MRDDFTCFDAGNYMQCTIHRVISIQNANAQTQMRYDLQKYKNGAMQLQTKTVGKAPRESFLQVDLPVHSDPTVRDQYLNFRGGIRFGKLLEDIDAFAGYLV